MTDIKTLDAYQKFTLYFVSIYMAQNRWKPFLPHFRKDPNEYQNTISVFSAKTKILSRRMCA